MVCSHPVYLAQRLRVQGQLYHRTCFRCARCSAQLTLVDYYETHDGKFVCETCPDERREGWAETGADTTGAERNTTLQADHIAEAPGDDHITEAPGDPHHIADTPVAQLSPAARQSIVAMRRMFFDTDDAKLTRHETLRADLPADIPISPNDQNAQPLHIVDDKLSESPKITSVSPSSLELPNTEACVYQSDNASPSILRLEDKSNSSLNLEDNLEDKSIDRRTSRLNKTSEHQEISSFNAQISPTKIPRRTISDSQLKPLETIDDKPSKNNDNKDEIASNAITAEVPANSSDSRSEKHELKDDSVGQSAAQSEERQELEGISQIEEKDDFGESEGGKDDVVEAVNEFVAPPRPKRRQKSPKAAPKDSSEYPQDLNPFGDDDDDEAPVAETSAGTNPFGSDSDEETENAALFTSTPIKTAAVSSTSVKSPYKASPSVSPRTDRRMSDFSLIRKAPSLNPFEDSDEEELEDAKPATPVPLPR